tara:strand:+ start:226 stop:408 length:183 start_codon:yes stop_codon:yes gene_type:complete
MRCTGWAEDSHFSPLWIPIGTNTLRAHHFEIQGEEARKFCDEKTSPNYPYFVNKIQTYKT